jgi:hypothetical protein
MYGILHFHVCSLEDSQILLPEAIQDSGMTDPTPNTNISFKVTLRRGSGIRRFSFFLRLEQKGWSKLLFARAHNFCFLVCFALFQRQIIMESAAFAYQQIISCNNEGVRFMLHDDDSQRAVNCFKTGITLIRSRLSAEDQPSEPHYQERKQDIVLRGKIVASIPFAVNSSGVHESDVINTKTLTHDLSSDFIRTKPSPVVLDDKVDGFVSFFARALVISESAVAEICEMGDPCSLLSAVILFNIALSHHRAGLQSATQSFRLYKALSLYGVVTNILERSQDQTISNKFGLLIYLASCNNMAHIYSEMCAFQDLRISWRNLFDVCVAYHQIVDYALDPEEQDVFLLNAFLFSNGANLAPAA